MCDNSVSRRCPLRVGVAAALVLAALLSMAPGCSTEPRPPATLAELAAKPGDKSYDYTVEEILAYNFDRVLDDRLSDEQRIESLSVLLHLDGANAELHKRLAKVLTPPDPDAAVQQVVLHLLALQDVPTLGPHVAVALPTTTPGRFQRSMLDWLTRHPQPGLLGQVVRRWAAAGELDDEDETRFRRVVETATGETWSQALLDGLNSDRFLAKGSALTVLKARVEPKELHRRVLALSASTPAVEALQTFVGRFASMPDGEDLLAAVLALDHRRDAGLEAAASVAKRWADDCGYRFDIRDLHLLSRLAGDESRPPYRRETLLASLERRLAEQTYQWTAGVDGAGAAAERFQFVATLQHASMADLVRLDLLCEMFNRTDVQRMLRQTALRDREDTTTQWGGLIVYLDGRAQGRLYLPGQTGDDQRYRANRRMIQDAADCLAHFHCRFDQPNHVSTVPAPDDLARLKGLRTRGVILTSTDPDHFAAVFYLPDGTVIPIGTFPFVR